MEIQFTIKVVGAAVNKANAATKKKEAENDAKQKDGQNKKDGETEEGVSLGASFDEAPRVKGPASKEGSNNPLGEAGAAGDDLGSGGGGGGTGGHVFVIGPIVITGCAGDHRGSGSGDD
jgi:hypothetical protein